MAEWMKARDSKSRILKRIGGSNPSLSAIFDGVDDTEDKKTGRHGDGETWRSGHQDTRVSGDQEIMRPGGKGSYEVGKMGRWEDKREMSNDKLQMSKQIQILNAKLL